MPLLSSVLNYVSGRSVPVIVGLMVLLIAAFGLALLEGVKPWELGIDERLAEGKSVKLKDYVRAGQWYAAALNLPAALLLLATFRWWVGAGTVARRDFNGGFLTGGRGFLIALALIMVFGGWKRAERLDHSFGSDEEHSFRRHIFGYFQPEEDGGLRLRRLDWSETLWQNSSANNHVLFSVLARMSHAGWETFAAVPERPISEVAVRFPTFVAGVLSIGLVGLLLAHLGLPRAGIAAAFVLAVHPWHVRYASEGRGYGLVLCLLVLGIILLLMALRSGRWRWWWGFALCQFGVMWAYPASLYTLSILNLAAVVAVLWEHRRTVPVARALLWQWLVVNVVAGIVFVQLMMPNALQLRSALESDVFQGEMSGAWVRDVWTHMAVGIPSTRLMPDDPARDKSLPALMEDFPMLWALIFVVVPGLMALGAVRLFLSDPKRALFPVSLLGGAVVAFLLSRAQDHFLFAWYMITALPAVVILSVAALDWPVRRMRVISPLLLVVFSAVFLGHAWRPVWKLRNYDRQPLRQAVEIMRGDDAYGEHTVRVITGSFSTSKEQYRSYDPRIHVLRDLETFLELEELSEATGRPFFVSYSGRRRARREEPEILAVLEDEKRFRHVATLPGLEEMFTFQIYERVH